jgi:hypothetical protein
MQACPKSSTRSKTGRAKSTKQREITLEIVTSFRDNKVYFLSGRVSELACADLELPQPYFISTFFFHNTGWNHNDLRRLLRRLIRNGCAYLLFHGHECEHAHDLADELRPPEETDENVIMTTWHKDESLKDILFDTFIASHPAEDYMDNCSSYAIFSFGSTEENAEVERLLGDLEATIKQAVDEDRDLETIG